MGETETMIHLTIQGQRVPALGLGTWQLRGDDCREAVRDALELGYRHIDTAQGYDNEEEVGRGLQDAGVAREEVFLVTKVRPSLFARDKLLASAEESLRKLRVDYLDLLLLHWPNPEVPLEETLNAMRRLQESGSVHHVGVSNFPPGLTKEASTHVALFANQVEYHPFLGQEQLLEMVREQDFMLTAYSPLAQGLVHGDETLRDIGRSYGKSPAQVALRWLLEQEGVAAIPKAAKAEHRRGNLEVFDFALSDEDKARIDALPKDQRLVDPDGAPDWQL